MKGIIIYTQKQKYEPFCPPIENNARHGQLRKAMMD
jgi:hypothetical protein